jgi:hypothetical protein
MPCCCAWCAWRAQNSSSIADLIASRFGKSRGSRRLVTGRGGARHGSLPRAAAEGRGDELRLLTGGAETGTGPGRTAALWMALAMALFAMLFGTRSATAAEHNRGLVLAMAFESLLKLGAMLALGAFVCVRPGEASSVPLAPRADGARQGFFGLDRAGRAGDVHLAAPVPRGHGRVRDERHLRTARWLFPLYLRADCDSDPAAGLGRCEAQPSAIGVPSDLYVLALPLSQGHDALALLTFPRRRVERGDRHGHPGRADACRS